MIERLNEILKEVGISKVKLAKYLGVSRQMIYNYLDQDSINKWPKDKKLMLFNLLGIKTSQELETLLVDTDYIHYIDSKLNNSNNITLEDQSANLSKKEKVLLQDVYDILKEKIQTKNGYNSVLYLYHYLQSMDTSVELNYILGYISKATGFTKPLEFAFDQDEQFIFESIMFTAFNLYNSKKASPTKIASTHELFVQQIEQKREEKMSRTLELTTLKAQALKELGYTSMTEENNSQVLNKMAEIQSRKVTC